MIDCPKCHGHVEVIQDDEWQVHCVMCGRVRYLGYRRPPMQTILFVWQAGGPDVMRLVCEIKYKGVRRRP